MIKRIRYKAFKKSRVFYNLVQSPWGDNGLVWIERDDILKVIQLILPRKGQSIAQTILRNFPSAVEQPIITERTVCLQIIKFLEGTASDFSMESLALGVCYDFQKKVLLEATKIPKGKVCTYGKLAERIHVPRAARAVGTALARNPFPLIFPCHRVVKATRAVGEFGGGSELKKTLLQREGVSFDKKGKIVPSCFW